LSAKGRDYFEVSALPRDVEEEDFCRPKVAFKQSRKVETREYEPSTGRDLHTDPELSDDIPSLRTVPILVRPDTGPSDELAPLLWCNEVLCTWLANKIGIAVESIAQYRDAQVEHPRMATGLLFDGRRDYTQIVRGVTRGTLYAQDRSRTYEILPRQWHNRIANRNDCLGMLVFDLWMGSTRKRHTIYWRNEKIFRAIFLSHGKFFYSDSEALAYHPCGHGIEHVLQCDPLIYQDYTMERVQEWVDKIEAFTDDEIEEALNFVGASWKPADYDNTVKRFLNTRRETARVNIDLICSGIDRLLLALKVK